jgi:hypothetical protein
MSSIFEGRKVYGGKWSVKATRNFDATEKGMVNKAIVVDSDYGLSCCFMMNNGTSLYIPMSNDSTARVGDKVDLETATIVTLEKPGEADIQRIKA